MSFAIVTDTSANLPCELIHRNNIHVIPFPYFVNGNERTCPNPAAFDGKHFYKMMRAGARVTTTLISPQKYIDTMQPLLEADQDILYIGMSSGISGAYAAALSAIEELREKYPSRQIAAVDSLGAALGEGLLVMKAIRCRQTGDSIEQTLEILLDYRMRICQIFTVDDLSYLRRGGRISHLKAIAGTMLHVKPLLKASVVGKIENFAKVRGRKHALSALAEHYKKLVRDAADQTVGITYAGCPEDAATLADLIRKIAPPKELLILPHEPMTGSHLGPGGLALFFTGEHGIRTL